MNYLKSTAQGIEWPYSFQDLKMDYPNVSFSSNPSDEDLEAFSIFPVHPSPLPAHSPRLQKINEVTPVYSENKWVQSWQVRDATEEEIQLYDNENKPLPDWEGFANSFLSDDQISNYLSSSASVVPLLISSLSSSLLIKDGLISFSQLWTILANKVSLSILLKERVVYLANLYYIPENIISIINQEQQ
jgi:hypothetical protein